MPLCFVSFFKLSKFHKAFCLFPLFSLFFFYSSPVSSASFSVMATINIPTTTRMSHLKSDMGSDRLASFRSLSDFLAVQSRPRCKCAQKNVFTVRSMSIAQESQSGQLDSPNGPLDGDVWLFSLLLVLLFYFVIWDAGDC